MKERKQRKRKEATRVGGEDKREKESCKPGDTRWKIGHAPKLPAAKRSISSAARGFIRVRALRMWISNERVNEKKRVASK